MTRLVLDAGAFVAFERGAIAIRAQLAAAQRLGFELTTTAPVVGQVWRDGRKQAVLARLLAAVHVDAPTEAAARRTGELLAKARTKDIVDALLVGRVRHGDTVLTARLLTELLIDARQQTDPDEWRTRKRSTKLDITALVAREGRLLIVTSLSAQPYDPPSRTSAGRHGRRSRFPSGPVERASKKAQAPTSRRTHR